MNYPDQWRETCRQILKLRLDGLRRENPGRRLGWQIVRDEIMIDFDTYRLGIRVKRDDRLVRQDLGHFVKGSAIKDGKLWLIDRYVRKLERDGGLKEIRGKILDDRAANCLQSLYSMYFVDHSVSDAIEYVLSRVERSSCAEYIVTGDTKSIFCYVEQVTSHGIRFIIGYCPRPLSKMTLDDGKKVTFATAYAIPRHLSDHFVQNIVRKRNRVVSVKAVVNCVVKAFVEFPGENNLTAADGTINILFSVERRAPSVEQEKTSYYLHLMDYPNSVVSPDKSEFNDEKRYAHATEVGDPSSARLENVYNLLERYVYRIPLKYSARHHNFIESIVKEHYNGYLI